MLLLASVVVAALLLAIPAIATIREVFWPRDDGRLLIAEQYVRDPRWFGRSYREKLAPFVAAARGDAAYDTNVHLRTPEETRWEPDMEIPAHERLRGIAVGNRIHIGQGAGIRDAYALASLTCDRTAVARTLTCDGTLFVGDSVEILRWIDADGAIEIGADTNLGVSASGGAAVTLADRVRFQRVWGKPVTTRTATTLPFALAEHADTRHVAQGDVAADAPLIVYGPVRIAAGTTLPSDIKVHGPLTVESGVRIAGSVIVRGDATFAADVTVDGHVFSEGDIRLGPGCRVGRSGGVKTVYAAGQAWLANDVAIEGWLVAEDGGSTL
jgi:predicted acyltransferase (DUF342 family)